LSTGPDSGLPIAIYRESAFQAVEVSSAVDNVWVLGVSEYGFEFISDLNSEFLIFFSSWTLWLDKKGYCPHVLYLVIDCLIRFLSLSASRT